MWHTISNSDDVIDSRDVIARIEELELMQTDAQEAKDGEPEPMVDNTEIYTSVDFGAQEYEELKALQSLAEEGEGSPDWNHGETLIRDSYFEDYARQLADDIGAIDKDCRWPNDCIDWEKAADQLKSDYMTVDYDGVEYWIRA